MLLQVGSRCHLGHSQSMGLQMVGHLPAQLQLNWRPIRTASFCRPYGTTKDPSGPQSPMEACSTTPEPGQKKPRPWLRPSGCLSGWGQQVGVGSLNGGTSGAHMVKGSPSNMSTDSCLPYNVSHSRWSIFTEWHDCSVSQGLFSIILTSGNR